MTAAPGVSYVVTGGAQGVGRAIAHRLHRSGHVVVVDTADPDWLGPDSDGVDLVVGSAADPGVAARAAAVAEARAPLAGWVNNAAVFDEARLDTHTADDVVELIRRNLAMAVVGTAQAVRTLSATGRPGAVVNVSSHQAQRPVRGALPYATAKAAVEGLTRAAAVDHGPQGIRVNAVALGSIRTERYEAFLSAQSAASAAAVERQMADLHPLGRVGAAAEVAEVVAWLLSDAASFVSGAVVPVDGGRASRGADPEER